jgi:hypothetical protein
MDFLFDTTSHRLWGPPISLNYDYKGESGRGRDADLSPPSNSEVKKAWAFTSAATGLHAVVYRHRDKFSFILHVYCCDDNQIAAMEHAVSLVNELLNSNGRCPDDVQLVKNRHHGKEVGLCPFQLNIDYDAKREPAVIIEAKCTDCKNKRCSKRNDSTCTELKKGISVTYLKEKVTKWKMISVGCFCASQSSTSARQQQAPISG